MGCPGPRTAATGTCKPVTKTLPRAVNQWTFVFGFQFGVIESIISHSLGNVIFGAHSCEPAPARPHPHAARRTRARRERARACARTRAHARAHTGLLSPQPFCILGTTGPEIAYARPCTRTRTHARTRTHTHPHTHTHVREVTRAHRRARAHARTHARRPTHARALTSSRTRANARAHARMHTRACCYTAVVCTQIHTRTHSCGAGTGTPWPS